MSYRERARAYFSAVNRYDADLIESMVEENYIQHNPHVPTGRAAFVALLPKLKTFGSKITNVRMLNDGKHVIMHHRWDNATPFGADKMVAFHIIRFNDQGLIAEHWSVMNPDTPVKSSQKSLADGSTQIEDLERTHQNKSRISDLFKVLAHGGDENTRFSDFFNNTETQSAFEALRLSYRKQHKIFAEGNFVLSISEAFHGNSLSATYDLFRIENEKIAEHWRILQPVPTTNLANNNTMFGFQP
jgi:predicted SnoaL-like aldol condensation-catalyzing enzyme